MSEPFLAEIRIVGFTFAPRGWALCDGQILPINQNQSLFSLLGTTYGGDGQTTFALPELRGRTPMHAGTGNGATYPLGQTGGEETHTLSVAEMPSHQHQFVASASESNSVSPIDSIVASGTALEGFRATENLGAMADSGVLNTGGGQAHNNMQPFLALNYCIALQGLFPSPN